VVRCTGKSVELVHREWTVRQLQRREQRVVGPYLTMRREVEHRCAVHAGRQTRRRCVLTYQEHRVGVHLRDGGGFGERAGEAGSSHHDYFCALLRAWPDGRLVP
jgi:hypothetical protein